MWVYSPFAMPASSCSGPPLGPSLWRRSGIGGFDIEAREQRLGLRQPAGFGGVGTPREFSGDRRTAVAARCVRVLEPQRGEDARRSVRDERRGGEGDEPARLDEIAEHVRETLACSRIPRLRG